MNPLSNIRNELQVIPAFTNRKDATLLALNKLESSFTKTKQSTHIVVSGEFKVSCKIKKDY